MWYCCVFTHYQDGEKRELTVAERSIMLLHSQDLSQKKKKKKIAEKMKHSRHAIKITLKRYQETGSYENRPKSGRKRTTTGRQDRYLVRLSLRNRFTTSKQLAVDLSTDQGVSVCDRTVKRRLVEANLKSCKPRCKPYLTQQQMKNRLLWAKKYRNWTVEDWSKIIWSDESDIEIFGTPGAQFVHRRPGEAFRPDCILPTVKHGGGSVMISGCMFASGKEILQVSVAKIFGRAESEYLFQQDNAPCHKSRRSIQWFRENGIRLFEWPAQPPDLSPIENLCRMLKLKLSKYKCKSKTELKDKIVREWELLSPNICQRLVESMPRRVNAVIKANGGVTKY
ncbi:Transposable element Tc1 transposase [Anthophora plagiata]